MLPLQALAQAQGDTTILDGLDTRFECAPVPPPRPTRSMLETASRRIGRICHGYPLAAGENHAYPRATLMTGSGKYIKGTSSSQGQAWRLYTAIFDGGASELIIDGSSEARGELHTDPLEPDYDFELRRKSGRPVVRPELTHLFETIQVLTQRGCTLGLPHGVWLGSC